MSKQYFSTEALSSSGIKKIVLSPHKYMYARDNPFKDTSALRIGRALHNKMLEPDDNRILVFDETITFESKAGRKFLEENPDTINITMDEYSAVTAMELSLLRDKRVMQIIDECPHLETELYNVCEVGNTIIPVKAMLDGYNDSYIFDLKTTRDDANSFIKSAYNYGYHIQAAWYRHMLENMDGNTRRFIFIVVESVAPYEVICYETRPETFAKGLEICEQGKLIYAECLETGIWPKYDSNLLKDF